MKQKVLIFLFVLSFLGVSFAQQQNSSNSSLGINSQFGVILKHRNSMGHLVNSHIGGLELSYNIPTNGKKLWHYENNFPTQGICFNYIYLGNPQQLGNIYAICPFYEIPLNKHIKPFTIHMRLAAGLAYLNKHFDPLTNHKNNVVSAPINAYINFKWMFKWNVNERLKIISGINFAHVSNAKAKVPNIGINMAELSLGATYAIKHNSFSNILCNDSSGASPSKNEFYSIYAIGINEIYPVGGRKYFPHALTFGYYLNKRNTHKFGLGVDIYYNGGNYQEMVNDSIFLDSKLQNIQIGTKFSYAYNIGRLSLPIEFGYYIVSKFKEGGDVYNRIGIRYHAKSNIIYSLTLKTHLAVANNIEVGIGYKINGKKKNWHKNSLQ